MTWYKLHGRMAAMLCDVVRRRRRRWAHAPVIHAASHFDHKNILDPRALVFYHVTDGDRGSGELYARVARIWLQGSHRACACFQNHCNDILLRYFVEKLSRRQ